MGPYSFWRDCRIERKSSKELDRVRVFVTLKNLPHIRYEFAHAFTSSHQFALVYYYRHSVVSLPLYFLATRGVIFRPNFDGLTSALISTAMFRARRKKAVGPGVCADSRAVADMFNSFLVSPCRERERADCRQH